MGRHPVPAPDGGISIALTAGTQIKYCPYANQIKRTTILIIQPG
jgi:hypothetical protein